MKRVMMRKWIGCISGTGNLITVEDECLKELCSICPDRTILRAIHGGWPASDRPDCVMEEEKGISGSIG